MPRRTRIRRILGAAAVLTLIPSAPLLLGSAGTAAPPAPASAERAFAPRLVTVDTPTRADKQRLQRLGLDLTEHAGQDYVEVVLHSAAEQALLAARGFTSEVRIPDLLRRQAQNNQIEAAYAAATTRSPMPSGRDAYRTLADYENDMRALAQVKPDLARRFELPHRTLDGRPVYGIEIAKDVARTDDGRPTFFMMGVHHAREWPSGELSMEFAWDLVKNFGREQRITDLLAKVRVVVVPVTNPDGFHLSRTDGALLDLRDLNPVDPLGGTTAVLATPNQAYKRKNCRLLDGVDTPDGTCAATLASPGGYGVGVDLNRNYAGFWGGPGASDQFVNPTYRGPSPFSEPETQNIKELVSSRQVTTLVSNHTFSNLVLRPNGVHPDTIGHDGLPVGDAPDEAEMAALGRRMTDANGYANIQAWQLYDTTGTTDDWSYNATGAYSYTFEIGAHEFHPPFPEVVDEYVGAGAFAGRGNREAFLLAAENAANPATHARITGTAPAGATLRLAKEHATPTWSGSVGERLESTLTVPANGRFTWGVNQSTRPVVQEKLVESTQDAPVRSQSFTGGATTPGQSVDHSFTVTDEDRSAGADVLRVDLDWPAPDDFDLEVYRRLPDGSLSQVGTSGNAPGAKESLRLALSDAGEYVLRVVNFAAVSPRYELTASLFDVTTVASSATPGLIENWTLTCEVNGRVRQSVPVVVDRGGQVRLTLSACGRR